jgi:hypothetical protein
MKVSFIHNDMTDIFDGAGVQPDGAIIEVDFKELQSLKSLLRSVSLGSPPGEAEKSLAGELYKEIA